MLGDALIEEGASRLRLSYTRSRSSSTS
ncbi:hypothetical protein MY11210_008496 [Beauveria gryllotalpidicola]